MKRRDFLKQTALAAAALPSLKALALGQDKLERKGAPRRVIVIGAGLAGLSAAYELSQAGHEVIVLEARARPGGRVFTLREPFSDGLYCEAGAISVSDSHHWTMKYIKLLDLTLDPIAPANLSSLLYMKGKRIEMKRGQPVDWPLDLTPEEQKLGRSGMWNKYVAPALKEMGDTAAAGWPPDNLKKYDKLSFDQFVRTEGASSDAAGLMTFGGLGALGDGPHTVSALDLLREAAQRSLTKQSFRIRGGSDVLPRALAARLADKIHYGAPVVRIEHSAAKIRAAFVRAGTQTSLDGDYLVCALPFTVLRQLEIAPQFSAEKQTAIQQMQLTSVARIYMQTRKRFWVDEGLSGFALTDMSNMFVSDVAVNPTGPRGILESYTAGPQAREVTAMKETERVHSTLAMVEKVHPKLRENFELGASKCWDEDEWARGAYTWFKPGQMIPLMQQVSRPEGRVHFAGEHASSTPGWMQGALESGNRVAREIVDAANERI